MPSRQTLKQILGLSAFAALCMALGMGLSRPWVARALDEQAVTVDPKGLDRMPPIAEVAEKLNPTVVYITNKSFVKSRQAEGPGGGDPFFDFFFGPGGRRAPRNNEDDGQMVASGGSGVIISPDGEILTNHHVIEGFRGAQDPAITVKLSDGREMKAKVVGKDKELDIALIKIEAAHLPFAKLGDSDTTKVGEWVVAIGNPLGLEHTVTQGIISAKGRSARELGGGFGAFLQTDAAINRGNSGGPLLNLRGEVVGINTAIRPDGQNIGFAVPVASVKRILPELRAGRPVSRGALGLLPAFLDDSFQQALGVKQGVVVQDVTKGQAADKAGVQQLDVITSVDGVGVNSPDDLIAQISSRRAGDKVKLDLVRQNKPISITVTLGDRKDLNGAVKEEDEGREDGKEGKEEGLNLMGTYGFTVDALTPATRALFQIAAGKQGVVVTKVNPRSPAADKGLQPGLVIQKVGTTSVTTLQEFNAAVKKSAGKPLLLYITPHQGDQHFTLAVPPAR
jgi:serine protease Do